MSRLEKYIMAPGGMNEASYQGNIGFEELAEFYQVASDNEKEKMERILQNEDWEAFKQLIQKVIGTKLT